MIVEKTMYQVKCDGCDSIATEHVEIVAWTESDHAEYEALGAFDYIKHNGKHYCPNCTEWNEDESERVPK